MYHRYVCKQKTSYILYGVRYYPQFQLSTVGLLSPVDTVALLYTVLINVHKPTYHKV